MLEVTTNASKFFLDVIKDGEKRYSGIRIDSDYELNILDKDERVMDKDTQVTYWVCIAKNTYDEIIDIRLDRKIQNMYDLLNDNLNIIDLDVSETNVQMSEVEESHKDLIEYLKNKVK